MRTAFLQKLITLMYKHEDVVTLTADMGFSVFEDVQKQFPKRFINTGVTEQSSIGIAAGFALSGYKVFFYAQAPFATMRCFEQIRLDIAYNHLNVKIVGAASGFSLNQLGVSHFALEDVALMRLLPNMTIFTPGDPIEAAWATIKAYEINGPAYIRITKSGSPIIHKEFKRVKLGKGIKMNDGDGFSLFVSGSLLPLGKEIIEYFGKVGKKGSLISIVTIKPIDKNLILKEAKRTKKIFTLEEHSIIGGLGSTVAEILAESGINAQLLRLGAPDKFTGITGSQSYLLQYNGLSKEKIVKIMQKYIKNE